MVLTPSDVTQVLQCACARRRFRQVTGASFAGIDEHLESIKDIAGWNAVFVGRILMRTLPKAWSVKKLTAKGATKSSPFRKDVNNQLLPTIRGFVSREIEARGGGRKGKTTSSKTKAGINYDASIARAAKATKRTEEDIEALIKGPKKLPAAVAEALSEEWKGPSRRRTSVKAMREAHCLYLST